MNSDVHPVVAGLVLLMTAVAVALWAWASGVAGALGGPAALQTNPAGHYFIEIQNYLVEHDEEGEYLRTHDLDAIEVELILGGFAFFSNGDVLLRRGADPRSFLDNVRAYKRDTNQNSIVPDTPGHGLYRCNLSTTECSRFGDAGVDFKAAFRVFIDWQTDEVYISDTTRHLMRKYSPEGVELAPPAGGFKFPNHLVLYDGQLLVADTNNHVLRRLDPDSSRFGEIIDSKSVVPAAATSARQTWPNHFARVGERWWVNNMRTGMDEGGLYVFDNEWEYIHRVELPSDADPISIMAVGETVWISDWNNDVVRRFSSDGKPLRDLESAGLETVLKASREERFRYTLISYAGVALVVLMLLGLVVRAFALGMHKGPAQKVAADDTVTAIDDGGTLHLEPDPKARKRMTAALRLMVVLTLLVVVSIFFLFGIEDDPDTMLPLALIVIGLVGIVALIAWTNKANWGTSILVDGNTLTLRDHTGRQSSCPIRQVRYDKAAIATRDAVVVLGRARAEIYAREDIDERLLPRLGEAENVGPLGMLGILIQFRHPQGMVTLLTLVGLLIYGVVSLA